VTYPSGKQIDVEFQIEDEVCVGANGKWFPGVVYNPNAYGRAPFGQLEDIGEIISYGINEGRFTEHEVHGIHWRVRPEGVALLREHGIVIAEISGD